MTTDRQPLWQPFSEPSTDAPLSAEPTTRLPVAGSLFREPALEDPHPDLPRQPAGEADKPLGTGGLTFTAATASDRWAAA